MADRRLEGLALKVGPLGENDRLLSLLSDAEGVTRLAVPGARRPKSSLAAAAPLLREALEGHRATLGDRHPKTLASINTLRKCERALGEEEAKSQRRE